MTKFGKLSISAMILAVVLMISASVSAFIGSFREMNPIKTFAIEAEEIPVEKYAENGIMPIAESAYTLTATLTPAGAVAAVDWHVEAVNASDPWVSGRDLSAYVIVTPQADGALTATVQCLEAFGAQLKVVVSVRNNSSLKAECVLDYEPKVGISINSTSLTPMIAAGTEITFNDLIDIDSFAGSFDIYVNAGVLMGILLIPAKVGDVQIDFIGVGIESDGSTIFLIGNSASLSGDSQNAFCLMFFSGEWVALDLDAVGGVVEAKAPTVMLTKDLIFPNDELDDAFVENTNLTEEDITYYSSDPIYVSNGDTIEMSSLFPNGYSMVEAYPVLAININGAVGTGTLPSSSVTGTVSVYYDLYEVLSDSLTASISLNDIFSTFFVMLYGDEGALEFIEQVFKYGMLDPLQQFYNEFFAGNSKLTFVVDWECGSKTGTTTFYVNMSESLFIF